jgi:hypothetical protein
MERIAQLEELLSALNRAINTAQELISNLTAVARPDHVERILLVKEDLEVERNQVIREILRAFEEV